MPSSKEFFKLDLKNKLILVRVDLNLPVINGVVQDETRLQSVLPTIQEIIKKGGKVVLCSHFGRPNGEYNKKYSLKPLIEPLSKALNCPIIFSPTCIGPEAEELKNNLKEGQTLLLENLRFHKGEETNNKDFSEDLTLGIDYFVNDAFSCSHRRHSSTVGVTNFLPSFMGTHLEKEIKALESSLLKKELLSLPPNGVLGYHPAKLPQNRGRHPLIWSLVLGLEESASTFYFMDEGADSGDILSQKDFEKLSQPYQRKEGQKEKGTGLGLNISVAIFKEHGFHMSVEKLDVGTMIKVKIR